MGTYATSTTLDLIMVGVNFSATDMSTLSSKAVDHAESEVNKHLSKRYDLSSSTFQTSTSVPPLVRTLTERIAEGYMWQWMSRGGKEDIQRGKDLVKEAITNLKEISSYQAHLYATSGSIIAEAANAAFRVQCNTTDYTSTFAEDESTGWAVDADKLDDISNSRD